MIASTTRFRQSLEVSRQMRLAQEIARGQAEISTQKRILAPSDDPLASARIAQIGRDQGNEKAWKANVEAASALASRADTALGSVNSILDRAKELMLNAVNGTNSGENRTAIAIELRSIANEIRSLADSKDARGEPLFANGSSLEIPVGAGLTIAPVDSRANVFGNVVTPSGAMDLSAIVDAAADSLEIADPAARDAAGQASLGSLDAALLHVATTRGEQGLRAARLDTINERFEDSAIKLTEERSNLESTDLAEAIARIQAKKVSLDAAQAIYAQLNQQTLFDLLR